MWSDRWPLIEKSAGQSRERFKPRRTHMDRHIFSGGGHASKFRAQTNGGHVRDGEVNNGTRKQGHSAEQSQALQTAPHDYPG